MEHNILQNICNCTALNDIQPLVPKDRIHEYLQHTLPLHLH